MGIGEARNELEENGGHKERKSVARLKEARSWPGVGETERERRRTEVAEVELMHAPGHAPKPLTGSQPTSLYDKYKRRAQRLLLIAWQKLRNPHFVLRTPDSLAGEPPISLFLSPLCFLPIPAYPSVLRKK